MLVGLGVAALAAWRLRSGDRLKSPIATIYAGAATLTPLAAVAVADMRLAHGGASGAMALAAALIGAAFVVGARVFRDGFPQEAAPAARIGLGAFSAGAVAALSSGLVFALDGGALTVSLALAALASAFVADRLSLAVLRWCVAALGLVIAGRLAYEPRIVGAALSPTPIFNWLLFGYGIPAAAFAYAGVLLRRQADDLPARAADALAVLFSAFLVFFEIRHATNGGDPFASAYGLVEMGLMSVSAFGFALALTRLDATRANVVFRWASLTAGALGVAVSTLGLLLFTNPFFGGTPVEGGLVVNALLIGYLLPAALACALAVYARDRRPGWYWTGAAAVSAALGLAYMLLETRVVFHGPEIGLDVDFTLGEMGVETSILLVCALALTALVPASVPAVLTTKWLAGVALACAAVGLGVLVNPVIAGDLIGGGGFFNALLLGYAVPASLFAAVARAMRGFRPPARARRERRRDSSRFRLCDDRNPTRFPRPQSRNGPADERRGILRLFGGLAAAGPGAARLWHVAKVRRGASRVGFFHHRNDAQGVRFRSGRTRRRAAGALLPRPGGRADRDRPRLSTRRLRQTAARNALRGLARQRAGAVTGNERRPTRVQPP